MLTPHSRASELVGFIAGFGTTFAVLPDLIKMLRQRSSKNVSPTMAAIMAAFQVVWIYYGFLIASRPLVAWNSVAVLINALSVATYMRYSRREKRRSP
ncbi:MAG TPA: SemiSWEET family transporter [Candidatus Krumholzibacteria bacterium]|nr:SemiSWEET family transporter [Candidatus Krumholzibacteria bacterium]